MKKKLNKLLKKHQIPFNDHTLLGFIPENNHTGYILKKILKVVNCYILQTKRLSDNGWIENKKKLKNNR